MSRKTDIRCRIMYSKINERKVYYECIRQSKRLFYGRKIARLGNNRSIWFVAVLLETDDFIGVHAGIPVKDGKLLPISQATCEQLVYDRRFKNKDILPQNGKCVLYGHTPVRCLTAMDEILLYPRDGTGKGRQNIADYCKIHLDTGVALSGVLGCFTVNSCQTFYVND